MISRRIFLKNSGLSALSLMAAPWFIHRNLFALTADGRKKTLVVIFQRGAMDGLSMVAPLGDPHYLSARPNIGLTSLTSPLTLDGYFTLHPSLGALKPFWDEGTLAFVHQVGSPSSSRSHFDAQDFMETGSNGKAEDKNIQDGFLNRAMGLAPATAVSPVRAVALQPNMPRILQGTFGAISMNSIHEFNIQPHSSDNSDVESLQAMYRQAADKVFRGVGSEIFDVLKTVHQADGDSGKKHHEDDGRYPKTPIAKRLRDIAELIKADIGIQLAVTDMGGWDTHVNQGAEKGQLSERFKEMGESLSAFCRDLGPRFHDVCIVTVTEFGRTVKENGNRGTDHGHGSVMSVLGGEVSGKKIFGKWKDLSPANLFEGRDLPVTTDYRAIFGELLAKQLGVTQLDAIFPKHDNSRSGWLNVLKS